ncbi:MAG: pantetheine-phosphate adenylyltransferase [Lachnospiraceae bacterium]|nr:pantetheine-phosphate adenylyltransferase [Lachnospiraceae bacterium]
MNTAIYPGSFDPITFGHLDIIKRSSKLFEKLIIGVLNNSQKKSLFTIDERVSMIKDVVKDLDNVYVLPFTGLTIDFARSCDARVIIRGLRAVTDFEYELQIAQTNRVEYPEIETLFLTTDLKYSYLSSTVVREFASYGGDITKFVPEEIIPLIKDKYK